MRFTAEDLNKGHLFIPGDLRLVVTVDDKIVGPITLVDTDEGVVEIAEFTAPGQLTTRTLRGTVRAFVKRA